MVRKEKFVPGEYYHIYSRTIFNAPEFKNKRNAQKLWLAFLMANSTNSSNAFQFARNNREATLDDILKITADGKKFVDILCYSIMPDHYHLLLKELTENGIVDFVRKANTAIAKYINTKNDRLGPLFESRFKSKHIYTNEYLTHLSVYIHLNPLDFIVDKNWREHKVKNWLAAKKLLTEYPWSSVNHYLTQGDKNSIISGDEIIKEQFKTEKEYENFLIDWATNTDTNIDIDLEKDVAKDDIFID